MPNLLAHIGVGSVLTRASDRTADSKWIYLGCMLPDLPWIAQRIVRAATVSVDTFDLRLYTTSQATLAGCILLSSALAVISAAPRRIFLILVGNSILHLLLDACQTKWGDGGVHLFAPVSWMPLNLGLFWPESWLTCALTLFGLAYCLFDLARGDSGSVGLMFGVRRVVLCLLLLVVYAIFPLATMQGALDANCHFVRTLKEVEQRPGRPLELDRARFRSEVSGQFVRTYGREDLRVDFTPARATGKVSIRGKFIDRNTVAVSDFHEHWPILRVTTSVVGIGLVVYSWLTYFFVSATRSTAPRESFP